MNYTFTVADVVDMIETQLSFCCGFIVIFPLSLVFSGVLLYEIDIEAIIGYCLFVIPRGTDNALWRT